MISLQVQRTFGGMLQVLAYPGISNKCMLYMQWHMLCSRVQQLWQQVCSAVLMSTSSHWPPCAPFYAPYYVDLVPVLFL